MNRLAALVLSSAVAATSVGSTPQGVLGSVKVNISDAAHNIENVLDNLDKDKVKDVQGILKSAYDAVSESNVVKAASKRPAESGDKDDPIKEPEDPVKVKSEEKVLKEKPSEKIYAEDNKTEVIKSETPKLKASDKANKEKKKSDTKDKGKKSQEKKNQEKKNQEKKSQEKKDHDRNKNNRKKHSSDKAKSEEYYSWSKDRLNEEKYGHYHDRDDDMPYGGCRFHDDYMPYDGYRFNDRDEDDMSYGGNHYRLEYRGQKPFFGFCIIDENEEAKPFIGVPLPDDAEDYGSYGSFSLYNAPDWDPSEGPEMIPGFFEFQSSQEQKTEKVFQVALLQSLTIGQYDGVISVEELKKHGDIGIGTFEGVNGEMIYLDGVMYQALGDGSVVEADDAETVPFATVAYFNQDLIIDDVSAKNLDDLKDQLDKIVEENGSNQFYFIKAEGDFEDIQVRSELKQEKPYKTLDAALKTDQREFSYEDVSGTIVAIYFPSYMGTLNTPGWHFHFISDDTSKGGHVLGLTGFSGMIEGSKMNQFEMYCPDSDTFNKEDLSVDQSDRIKSVEQKSMNEE